MEYKLIEMPLINLILLFPLIGSIICFLFKNKKPYHFIGIFASSMVFLSFIITCILSFKFLNENIKDTNLIFYINNFTWMSINNLNINFDLMFDKLTMIMLLVITFVGFLIHVYSIGYMHDDKDYNRFFTYLNLFIFFMSLLVMSKNIILMFVGWEGVGLCSYLLISFWWQDIENAKAGKKAFITNRIGDFAFLIAVMLIYILYDKSGFITNFDFIKLHENFNNALNASYNIYSLNIWHFVGILFFLGACGKSAQFPLYVWLPDAMAGPTPVSALIHAATMVTAGIYLCLRIGFIFKASILTLTIIATIGLFTAIISALIALVQTDIKKVLAYSTISQLGLMFTAIGCGAFSAALFHLVTHAFFKSLLFLAAGIIIHSLANEQNITKMGELRKYLPYTFISFFIGVYAISGLPLMSGFFSKDEILLYVSVSKYSNELFIALAFIVSILTATYMHRLMFLVFYGNYRGDKKLLEHIHEPKIMLIPVLILSFFSIFSGFIALNSNYNFINFLSSFNYLSLPLSFSKNIKYIVMFSALLSALLGVILAYQFYISSFSEKRLNVLNKKLSLIIKIQSAKFYLDEIYEFIIVKPLYNFSKILHDYIDIKLIDNFIINGITNVTKQLQFKFTLIQSGNLSHYILMTTLGMVILTLIIFKDLIKY